MIEQIKDNDLSKIYHKAAVVFSASWCDSCHKLLDMLEPISDAFDTKIYNADVDINDEISTKYGIKSLPCTVLFKDGEEHIRLGNNVFLNDIVDAIRSI